MLNLICQHFPSVRVWLTKSRSFPILLATITSLLTRLGNLRVALDTVDRAQVFQVQSKVASKRGQQVVWQPKNYIKIFTVQILYRFVCTVQSALDYGSCRCLLHPCNSYFLNWNSHVQNYSMIGTSQHTENSFNVLNALFDVSHLVNDFDFPIYVWEQYVP